MNKSKFEQALDKRELQLQVKEMGKSLEQLKTGRYAKSALETTNTTGRTTKSYIIEPVRKDADGAPIDPAQKQRILTEETFVKAADGIVEVDPKGQGKYIGCFAAGTLVHTDQGMLPIEKVRVGARVLSQPEHGGERAWRPVINTVAHLDQPVFAVQVRVEGTDALSLLIATGNHPFWVESPLADGKHWLAAECLEPGFVLQLNDGRQASVHVAGLIRRTQHARTGFAGDDRAGVGVVLDLGDGPIKQAGDELALSVGKLALGDAYLTPVYNFEVEEFHTYYVGEVGVWVHNTNCNKTEATGAENLSTALETKAIENEIKETCFSGDTVVHMEGGKFEKIKYVAVGDKVLSRCEITGEMAYKKVIKKFHHEHSDDAFHDFEIPAVYLYYTTNHPNWSPRGGLHVTPEHPIWVNGKGWTAVYDIRPGDVLCTADGAQPIVESIDPDGSTYNVYNLHVEDFHTYFVANGIWVHNQKITKVNANILQEKNPQAQPYQNAWLQDRNALEAERRGCKL